MIKKALITGITGQDGAYLSRLLLEKGYEVHGTSRPGRGDVSRLEALGIRRKVRVIPLHLRGFSQIRAAVERVRPGEVYNLAAQTSVATSFKDPLSTAEATGLEPLRVLEAVRSVDPRIKFYQASSSEMFGDVEESPQSEKTAFVPRSPYAVSRLFAHWMTVSYRKIYGMHACSGILYNHESPLRGPEFVTRKITMAAARIKRGLQRELTLGNLDARRDWGYAPEYVEAMWLMLQQPEPDDYVISTGRAHSVREFVEAAFSRAGMPLKWSGRGAKEVGKSASSGRVLVRIDPRHFRPADMRGLKGNSSKARRKLGWSAKTSFAELIRIMVDHDLAVSKSGGPPPA